MRVFYHSALISKELVTGSTFHTVPCKAYLELKKEKGDTELDIILNGKIVSRDSDKLDCDAEAELIICQNGEKHSYIVMPLVNTLSNKYVLTYEQFAYEYNDKLSNEIESIKSGALKMYAVDQSTEVRDWTDTFDNIENAFSAFKSICNKPKSHLKAVNEVRTIETVKRIGYESIPYLASHSEDWLAMTASGLKPARLFSRVEDDDFQIYENRVTKTLIDLIISFLRKQENDLRDKIGQLKIIMNSGVHTESFGFDVSFQKAVSELLNSDEKSYEYRSKALELASELHVRAKALLKKYRTLRQTKLYRYLKNTKPETNPLNETNILLMDKHYSVVFKLWKSVRKDFIPQKVTENIELEFGFTYSDYLLFCRTLCGYTAHVLNFDIIEDGRYYRSGDNLEITIKESHGLIRVTMRDKKKRSLLLSNGILSPIAAGNSFESFYFDGRVLFWDNDISDDDIDKFCSLFKTRESRGREQNEERKKFNALKKAVVEHQRRYTQTNRSEFVIIPAAVELENYNRNIFKDYVEECTKVLAEEEDVSCVVVALPICDKNEQKIISYARSLNEQTLILPLTMFDINSFRRLQNLMLSQIVSLETDRCPCCGGPMREYEDQQFCDTCSQLILTKTTCPYPECKHQYYYISYDTSEGTIRNMQSVDENKDFFMWDSLYQYKNIVDMSVDSGKIRTICPPCGRS